MDAYDVIVIGAGPAGYVAAIRAAQLNLKTVCIDPWMNSEGQASPGGTCLNVGCIPSKALLESSHLFEDSQQNFAQHGIQFSQASFDLSTMMMRKEKVVRELTGGVKALFQANGVEFICGKAFIQKDKNVEVQNATGNTLISGKNIIIATGSRPKELPGLPIDHSVIVDSSDALSFSQVPKRIGIIGMGVIALELGSLWRRLGAQVSLFKRSELFLPGTDEKIAKEAQRQLNKQGLEFHLGCKIHSCEVKESTAQLKFEDKGGVHQENFDKIIVAVGRQANSDEIIAEECGLILDDQARIKVNKYCESNVPGIYAIGDVVRGPMLAHKGSEEGIMVAERIAGQHTQVNYDTIPSVIYTHPEMAWVGKTEFELQQENRDYCTGIFPFASNGRAKAASDTAGMVKIIADARTDRVLGVHMLGPHCSELIGQAVIAMQFQASSEDLAMTIFAHPSLSEAVHEAALDVAGRAIHRVVRKAS